MTTRIAVTSMVALLLAATPSALAEEGMWPPFQLNELREQLKEAGRDRVEVRSPDANVQTGRFRANRSASR